ncbi:hypothetical protein THOM_1042 [Trachipleistophora hominis]|uniref:Uncharacterized protein n=1 Tax=Trachipleistophora hominis TaxID=72359 RepID=L7JXE6_TRAHO|nr:hypothetical protein THOM_1042 [Trachipleistophora hominis]
MLNKTHMQAPKYCFYTMLVLFASIGIVFAEPDADEDVLRGGLEGLYERVDEVTQGNNNVLYMLASLLPVTTSTDLIESMTDTVAKIANSYDIEGKDGFDDSTETKMKTLLEKAVDQFKDGKPSDKSEFTEMTKQVMSEFHNMVKEIVNKYRSPQGAAAPLQVSTERISYLFHDLNVAIEDEADGIVEGFDDACETLIDLLEELAKDPNNKNSTKFVVTFKELIDAVKRHIRLFYGFHDILSTTSDENTHVDNVQKKITKLEAMFNAISKKILNHQLEKKNFIATAKAIVQFVNDLRMSIMIIEQNRAMFVNRYVLRSVEFAESGMLEDIKTHQDEMKKKNTTIEEYDKMKPEDKKKLNIRILITESKQAPKPTPSKGSSDSSSSPSKSGQQQNTGKKSTDAKKASTDKDTTTDTATTGTDEKTSTPWYKNKWVWIFVIGAVVLAAVGVLAAILFLKK